MGPGQAIPHELTRTPPPNRLLPRCLSEPQTAPTHTPDHDARIASPNAVHRCNAPSRACEWPKEPCWGCRCPPNSPDPDNFADCAQQGLFPAHGHVLGPNLRTSSADVTVPLAPTRQTGAVHRLMPLALALPRARPLPRLRKLPAPGKQCRTAPAHTQVSLRPPDRSSSRPRS